MTYPPLHFRPAVIQCVECGATVVRDIRASLCFPCRKKRHQKRSAIALEARRERDPEYVARERARKAAWVRMRTRRNWPVPCAMCGDPIECVRGRKRTNAICRRCSKEHRAACQREREKRAA